MKKKVMPVFLIMLLILTSLSVSMVFADSTSTVELELDKTGASVGDVIKATVKISNIKEFAGYQVNVKYDPEVLRAVRVDNGTPFLRTTTPSGGTVLLNEDYGIVAVESHDIAKGIINFSRTYTNMADYKKDGKADETGILGVIGFEVLEAKKTTIKLEDTATLPNAISGTVLFDWSGGKITGYSVKQPGTINSSMEPNVPVVVPSPTPQTVTQVPVLNNSSKKAKSSIGTKEINEALDKAQASGGLKLISLEIEKMPGANGYIQEVPKEALSKDSSVHKIQVSTDIGKIIAPSNMLSKPNILSSIGSSSNVALNIDALSTAGLSAELKAQIELRPYVELALTADGKNIPWNNPDAPVTVIIPFNPTTLKEMKNHENIVVWYIDDSGKTIPVPSARYDHIARTITFTTTNFGKYAVTFVTKTFDDISNYAWAKKQIEVLAAKGVINGTSQTTFAPSTAITRGDFLLLLVKALGLTATVDSNFSDVEPSAYYYNAIGIAKKLKITTGVGDNKYNPKEKITRQDLMVLTTNALKIAGKVSTPGTKTEIERFTDKAGIASYATEGVATLVKEGIVVGSGNVINPRGNTSRAELAAIIYKIYNK